MTQKPNPYSFIERVDDGVFRCTHRQAVGTFQVKHLTVRNLSEIEMMRAALGGATVFSDDLALRQAYVTFGFEKKPEGFDPSKIRSEALLHALYFEVKSFHDLFREPAVEEPIPATTREPS